jgi:hypothetical protein
VGPRVSGRRESDSGIAADWRELDMRQEARGDISLLLRISAVEELVTLQFESDMPLSEDSNSDVSGPAPQCAVMDDVGCGQRSILP